MDLVLVLVMEPVLDIPSAVVILPVTVLATPAILPDPMATTTQDKVLLPVHTRRPMSLAVHLVRIIPLACLGIVPMCIVIVQCRLYIAYTHHHPRVLNILDLLPIQN